MPAIAATAPNANPAGFYGPSHLFGLRGPVKETRLESSPITMQLQSSYSTNCKRSLGFATRSSSHRGIQPQPWTLVWVWLLHLSRTAYAQAVPLSKVVIRGGTSSPKGQRKSSALSRGVTDFVVPSG